MKRKSTERLSLLLTENQRKALIDAARLPARIQKAFEGLKGKQPIDLTPKELEHLSGLAEVPIPIVKGWYSRQLAAVVKKIDKLLVAAEGKTGAPRDAAIDQNTVFQFKITLLDIEPPIWRRIQTKDCTLDKFHEHIQAAIGWTNSHLHQFIINGAIHGDPELLCEGWADEETPIDSRRIKLSQLVPKSRKRFRFNYEYDFGDGWEHEILFEGFPPAEKGLRYPVCIEGARACPPEDVGGACGYAEFLAAIADADHEEHESYLEWCDDFDPEKFNAHAATKEMQRGLPNWRNMM